MGSNCNLKRGATARSRNQPKMVALREILMRSDALWVRDALRYIEPNRASHSIITRRTRGKPEPKLRPYAPDFLAPLLSSGPLPLSQWTISLIGHRRTGPALDRRYRTCTYSVLDCRGCFAYIKFSQHAGWRRPDGPVASKLRVSTVADAMLFR